MILTFMIILGDISECVLTTEPSLSETELLILPENINQDKEITKYGAIIKSICIF
jgi:hypothetical protein